MMLLVCAGLFIPPLAGRDFTESDDVGAPGVAIVNEAFTRKFGLDGAAAVGKRIAIGRGEELDLEIVGVVADAAYSDARYRVPPIYFTPWRQDQGIGTLTFYTRTTTPPEQTLASITTLIRRLDPSLPMQNAGTLSAQLREIAAPDKIIITLAPLRGDPARSAGPHSDGGPAGARRELYPRTPRHPRGSDGRPAERLRRS